MSYATTDQLREYLSQAPAAPAPPAPDPLQTYLDRSKAILDEVLGFEFDGYALAATKDVRSGGGEYLWLPAHDPGSVTDVEIVHGRGTAYETTTTVDDWLAEETESVPPRLWRHAGWTRGAWYRVTADWGYGDAPETIVEIELEIAVNIWRSKDRAMFSDIIGVEGGGAVGYQRALTNQQRMVIDAVRMRVLGPGMA